MAHRSRGLSLTFPLSAGGGEVDEGFSNVRFTQPPHS